MYLRHCQTLANIAKNSGILNTSVTFQKSVFNQSIGNCFFSTTMAAANKKVAVILSGSGVYDGTEIHEAAACFAALTRHGATPIAYSIDKPQHHAIAHNSGKGMLSSYS